MFRKLGAGLFGAGDFLRRLFAGLGTGGLELGDFAGEVGIGRRSGFDVLGRDQLPVRVTQRLLQLLHLAREIGVGRGGWFFREGLFGRSQLRLEFGDAAGKIGILWRGALSAQPGELGLECRVFGGTGRELLRGLSLRLGEGGDLRPRVG